MEVWLTYLLLGAAAGTIAGLFGLGGGIIVTPALVMYFSYQGMDPAVLTHMAIGTSLATIVMTSFSSVCGHHKRRAINWPLALRLSGGMALGAPLGALLAAHLSGDILQRILGVYAVLIAIKMIFALKSRADRTLPRAPGQVAFGSLVGTASAMFGIGGGTITVPFLSRCSVPMRNAVATSAACGFPTALIGACVYLIGAGQKGMHLDNAVGYLYLPAFFGIVLASTPAARLGAKLAHKLPTEIMQRAFGVMMLAIGIHFLT